MMQKNTKEKALKERSLLRSVGYLKQITKKRHGRSLIVRCYSTVIVNKINAKQVGREAC